MFKATKYLLAAVLIAATSSANAFDGQREGIQLGIGIGAHSSQFDFEAGSTNAFIESEQRVAVSMQLGYGFSNRIVGYVGGKGGSLFINGQQATLAIAGAGGMIYLKDSSPSLYINGLIGSGSLALKDDDKKNNLTGFGWLGGIGYEVTDQLQVELSYGQADLVDPNNNNNKTTLGAAFVTIQYNWY